MSNVNSHVKPGDKAPEFTTLDDSGRRVSLADFKGKWVVLFFYPEADTPLCTDEACEFRDAMPQFRAAGAAVFGVSPDPVPALAAFHRAHRFGYPLLSDPGSTVSARYGVWGEKNMYGKFVVGMIRSTVLIAPDGRIARWWKRIRVKGHAARVAAEVAARSAPGRPAPRPRTPPRRV